MTATLAELEARVAALEAERADYKAVITTVNSLGEQTREKFDEVDGRLEKIDGRVDAAFTAINALSLQTRERFDAMDRKIDSLEERLGARIDGVEERLGGRIDDTNRRVRSIEEHMAELKDLLVEALHRR